MNKNNGGTDQESTPISVRIKHSLLSPGEHPQTQIASGVIKKKLFSIGYYNTLFSGSK